MLRSLYSGVSGMKSFQTKLDVIGNNIANVNTYGFKSGRVTFKDLVSQTMQNATSNGTNPIQIGSGTTVGSIDTLDTQGSSQNTGRTLDLEIQGDGYFQIQNNVPTNPPNYTRSGNFYLDSTGNLVTSDGSKVLDLNGNTINIPTGATDLTISQSGQITYTDPTTGTTIPPIQLGIVMFANPAGLTKIGDNMYQTSSNSGNPSAATIPGRGGSGTVQSGFLEMSNVDLSNEMTDMIVAQRGFQANTKIITTSDQILQDLINLKQ